jgi:hypothetical protein
MQLSGVAMARDGDRLNLDGPANFIDAFLPEIQRFKPALLELLTASPPRPSAPPIRGLAAAHFVTDFRMRHFDRLKHRPENAQLIELARALFAQDLELDAEILACLERIEREVTR